MGLLALAKVWSAVILASIVIPLSGQVASRGASQDKTSSPDVVFHSRAELVLVDVVVRDSSGNIVRDLDKSHFRVFEDGREKQISSFDRYGGGEQLPGMTALPPHIFSNRVLQSNAGTVNVLLLDGLNTPVENQADARLQMLAYVRTLKSGVPTAIFTLGSRLRMIEGFTSDPEVLLKTIDALHPEQSVTGYPTDLATLDATGNELARGGADIAKLRQFVAEQTAYMADQRSSITLDAFAQLARFLGGISGRKNLIWISGSFPIALDPNDSLRDPFRASRNFVDRIHQTDRLLASSRVAIYAVDAKGIVTLKSSEAHTRTLPNITSSGVPLPIPTLEVSDAMLVDKAERSSMQVIADETGGRAFTGTNDLAKAIESAADDGSSYYTLGYVPDPDSSPGHFHKIKIEVDNRKYRLSYRTGYYSNQPATPEQAAAANSAVMQSATAWESAPSTQIEFSARVLPGTDPIYRNVQLTPGLVGKLAAQLPSPAKRYVADLDVDPHGIRFESAPDGKRQATLEFALVAYDTSGKLTNYIYKGFQFAVDPQKTEQLMQSSVRVRLEIDVPPGPSELRIAVHDLGGGNLGSLSVPLQAE